MMSPAYAITATERILPSVVFDFTSATLDARINFARANNTATVIDSSGNIAAINADLPRFDYDPSTLICRGLLIEEQRTNLLLNSLLDGTDLTTQTVTVTNAAHTLSFYGAGTVVLSGAHSATVNGSGAYPSRTTLTFTPSVGSLTLTVTGAVKFANLELGAFATSFIPTDGTTKTRSPDLADITGANFSSWFNLTEGAFYTESSTFNLAAGRGILSIGDATLLFINRSAYVHSYVSGNSGRISLAVAIAGVAQVPSITPTYTESANTVSSSCWAYKQDSFAISVNATTPATDNSGNLPSPPSLSLGSLNSGWLNGASYLNGHLAKIMYWPQRIINAEVQAFSK